MIYFVNYMPSLYNLKNEIYSDLFKSHIENIDIKYKEFIINVTLVEDVVTPIKISSMKDGVKVTLSELQYDYENDKVFSKGTMGSNEAKDIIKKSKSTVEKTIPKDWKEFYGIEIHKKDEEGIYFSEDEISELVDTLKSSKKKVSIVECMAFPEMIKEISERVGEEIRIINLIRHPFVDYLLTPIYEDGSGSYSGIELCDESLITSLNLSILCEKIAPEITTTIRYEDYLFLGSTKVGNLEVKFKEGYSSNGYLKDDEVLSLDKFVVETRKKELKELKDLILSQNSSNYDNLPKEYTKDKSISSFLKHYKEHAIFDCLEYDESDNKISKKEFEEMLNRSIETSKYYNSISKDIEKLDGINFFSFFKYKVNIDLSKILYNKV